MLWTISCSSLEHAASGFQITARNETILSLSSPPLVCSFANFRQTMSQPLMYKIFENGNRPLWIVVPVPQPYYPTQPIHSFNSVFTFTFFLPKKSQWLQKLTNTNTHFHHNTIFYFSGSRKQSFGAKASASYSFS